MFNVKKIFLLLMLLSLTACAAGKNEVYQDANMDFGSIRTIAVMPFVNLSRDQLAGDRVRDVLINALLSTEAIYVLPTGEVARGVMTAEISNAFTPSREEVVKLGKMIKAEAIITGTIREYGDVKSGTASANVISMSLQMIETDSGRVVWTASSTQGGITFSDRLFGSGGQPMDIVTVKAVDDLINKLFGPPSKNEAKTDKKSEEKTEKKNEPKSESKGGPKK